MKGDFSRNTYDKRLMFSQVLMQMGRVLLDADWNQQGTLVQEAIRALTRDLIGPYGGIGNSFKIETATVDDFNAIVQQLSASGRVISRQHQARWRNYAAGKRLLKIWGGRYYVDGIPVEIEREAEDDDRPFDLLDAQPYLADSLPDDPLLNPDEGAYVLYLDVFERAVSAAQYPITHDPALGEADTSVFKQVVWQVCQIPYIEEFDERLFPLERKHRELAPRHPRSTRSPVARFCQGSAVGQKVRGAATRSG